VTDLRTAKVLVLAALATLLLATTTFSTAAFTDSSASTATVRAAADWTAPTVELKGTAGFVRGTVTLTADAADADSAVAEVRVEQRLSGPGPWTAVCAEPRSSATCAWDTTRGTDGEYVVRVTATDAAGNVGRTTATVTVDNTAPTLRLVDPGSPLSGTVRLAASDVADASGVGSVEFRYATAGSSTWTTLCTATQEPWSCDADTRPLPYGSYDLQARATDLAGNGATSARVADRVVDNVVSSVTLTPVPTLLTGPVTLQATPSSTAGVLYVRLQYAPAGTTTWTQICEVTRDPFTCSWDTTRVADGTYDVRAQLIDGTGRFSTSTVETGRRVQNTAPQPPAQLVGADVQAVNGGSRPGWLERGDSITFTFARAVRAQDVLPGWSGEQRDVTLRVRDGKVVGRSEAADAVDVLAGSTGSPVITGLGSVNLATDVYQTNQTATFRATMRMGTVTVAGAARTTVTVTLGDPIEVTPSHLREALPAHMVWTDPTGGVVTESGDLDRDF
jgi:chitinase